MQQYSAAGNYKTDIQEQKNHEKLSLDEQFKKITASPDVVIIPVNPQDETVVADGDTINYSENLEVHIMKEDESMMSFFEPLGDGFYYSSVKIANKNQGKSIEIKGQKKHRYTLFVTRKTKPETVTGAATWSYDENKKQIIIQADGKTFSLQIE